MNFLIDLFGIGDAIVQAFRTFFGYLAATVYSLIEYVYHILELLGRAEIIRSEFIKGIYTKVGTILSLFMLFKLIFSLIQSLINPEQLSDKKNGYGAIILRSIIAIVLLGTTPSIFREAYNIQNLIVGGSESDNVLYKLIAGSNTNGSLNTIGRRLSSDLYFDFFTDNEDPILDNGMLDRITSSNSEYVDRFRSDNFDALVEDVTNSSRDFYSTVDYLTLKDGNDYVIEVNWIPLFGVGIFVLYMIAMYAVQVGIRVVQLAYLQIVAPIPILSYISDPEGSFKRWINQCLSTYLDLFLRLIIIYFVMTLIGNILTEFASSPDVLFESTNLARESWITQVLVEALIIIGLLLFAKKVPDLIKDLFPNLGSGSGKFSFGLSAKKNLVDPLKDVGKTLYNSPVIGWGLKGGKKAWDNTGGRAISDAKDRRKLAQEDRKNRREVTKAQSQNKHIYDRYGNDFDAGNTAIENGNYADAEARFGKVFGNKEYANTYTALAKAKQAERLARKEGANSKAYMDAKAELEKAQKAHDNSRKKYGELARREDSLKGYRKPTTFTNSGVNNNQTAMSQERYHQLAEQANRRPAHFTEAERQAEVTRREQARSSDNNEHQAELASRSIFSDDEAMRQSDEGYRTLTNVESITGVNIPNASEKGAPTAENSIFSDDEAMRQSDAEYNRRNNVDTRTYDNDNPYGE